MDNPLEQQQSQRMLVKHHNTLPRSDIVRLLDHAVCSRFGSTDYLKRLILVLVICPGVRPPAIIELNFVYFQIVLAEGEDAFIFTKKIALRPCGSKKSKVK